MAPPWPGAFAEVAGRRVEVHAGEPAGPLPPGTAPGTVRREPDRLLVAAADRWFRIDAGEGIEIPRAAMDLEGAGASPSPLEGGKGIEGMRG